MKFILFSRGVNHIRSGIRIRLIPYLRLLSRTLSRGIVDTSVGGVGCHLVVVQLVLLSTCVG
jgi:hypothetical protein